MRTATDVSWGGYYLGLAVVAAILLGVVTGGVSPAGWISPGTVAWLLVAVLGGVALFHTYHDRRRRFEATAIFDDAE